MSRNAERWKQLSMAITHEIHHLHLKFHVYILKSSIDWLTMLFDEVQPHSAANTTSRLWLGAMQLWQAYCLRNGKSRVQEITVNAEDDLLGKKKKRRRLVLDGLRLYLLEWCCLIHSYAFTRNLGVAPLIAATWSSCAFDCGVVPLAQFGFNLNWSHHDVHFCTWEAVWDFFLRPRILSWPPCAQSIV